MAKGWERQRRKGIHTLRSILEPASASWLAQTSKMLSGKCDVRGCKMTKGGDAWVYMTVSSAAAGIAVAERACQAHRGVASKNLPDRAAVIARTARPEVCPRGVVMAAAPESYYDAGRSNLTERLAVDETTPDVESRSAAKGRGGCTRTLLTRGMLLNHASHDRRDAWLGCSRHAYIWLKRT